jgi:L-asparaginase
MRPRVLILATGGTIAGTAGSPEQTAAYRAGSLGIDELLARIPGLAEAADVGSEQIAAIDSKDATPEFWTHLASRVQAGLDDERVAGVVVTHGTDTMEESAYFLHLTVCSAKPVVFTGAMRPATALSADGPLNLLQAVRVAAHPSAAGKGVLVAMNNLLHSARDVAKTNAQRVDAFACPDTGPLGFVQDGTVAWYRSTVRRHTASSELAWSHPMPAVEILSGYAGASPRLIEAVVGMQAAGIVYAGTGNGTLSAAAEAALAQAVRQGVAVVRASRVGSGAVLRNAAADDDAHGFVAAGNLNPQKARVLLMLALQRTRDTGALQAIFDAY